MKIIHLLKTKMNICKNTYLMLISLIITEFAHGNRECTHDTTTESRNKNKVEKNLIEAIYNVVWVSCWGFKCWTCWKKNTRSINFQIVVITRKPWWECQQGGRIGQQKRRNHDQTKEDYFDLPIPRKKNNESPTPFTL